jgi:hypothetical protein
MSNEIYMSYKEWRSGGGVCAGQDNNEWPMHEPENIEFTPTFLSTTAGNLVQTIETDFDPNQLVGSNIWIVIVRYSTGNTFGSSSGHWKVESAHTDEQTALDIAKLIETDYKKYPECEFGREGKTPKPDQYFSPHGYECWKGYFESLEGVEIHRFTLSDKKDGSDDTRIICH